MLPKLGQTTCPHNRRCQDGVVLVIVLVVLVAMTLGSLAVFKSVDTGTLVSANMSYKRDAINRAGTVMNQAMIIMAGTTWQGATLNQTYCQTACTNIYNYSPRLLDADASGIPVMLKTAGNFGPSALFQYDAVSGDASLIAAGMKARFLIERMCDAFGPPSSETCVIAGTVALAANDGQLSGPSMGTIEPLYRVTVRVDGPRNTVAYTQAIVGVSAGFLHP